MSAVDDWSLESCKACGKKIDGINEFTEHVTTEHPIKENNNSYYEDSKHRRICLFKSYYETLCLQYVDEYDQPIRRDGNYGEELTEETPKTLMEKIKRNGWKYVRSQETGNCPEDDDSINRFL